MNPYDDEELSYTPAEQFDEPPYDFSHDEPESHETYSPSWGEGEPETVENSVASNSAVSIPPVMLEIVQTVASHSGQLQEQEQSIKWLLEKFKDESEDKPVPWSWRYVSGEERTMLWEELTSFVSWINHRYFADSRSKQIIPCWYRHGAIVEELTGLWAAWRAASFNAKKPNAKMADFHRRYFWPAMDKIALLSDSCSKKGEHTVYGNGRVREDDAEMMDFIIQDIHNSASEAIKSSN